MKITYQSILFSFILLTSLSACEDPIDLDLGPPVEQMIIDAVINNSADTQYIYISKSVAYLDNGTSPGYDVDSVGVLDTSTFTYYNFVRKDKGIYYFVPPSANTFIPGKDYQFLLKDGVNTFVSQSRLNSPTTIDSVTYRYETDNTFGSGEGYYLTLWAKDKVGVGDYYWLRLYRNDSLQTKSSDISIAVDNSFSEGGSGDGNLFIVPIRENFSSRPWKVGEKAVIEILSITPEMYYFLNLTRTQLQNVGLFAVPPSNIPSNIICINNPNLKVLGFFNMNGRVRSETIIIKQ